MNEFPSIKDRRSSERRMLRVTANLSSSGHSPMEVRTADISPDSLGVIAHINPPPGTPYTVRLNLPTLERGVLHLNAQVKVVHSILSGEEGGFKIGLGFTGLSSSDEKAIKAYLEQP